MSSADIIKELLELFPPAMDKKTKCKLRRTKRRLAKSLEKQLPLLLKSKSYEEVKTLLWHNIYLKHNEKNDVETTSSEDLSKSLSGEEVEKDTDVIYKSLHPLQKTLLDTLCEALVKEMRQVKLNSRFSATTVRQCNSAMCNGIVGFMNKSILSSDTRIIEETDIKIIGLIGTVDPFKLRSGLFGENRVLVKQICNASKLYQNAMLVLSHELKILSHLGDHPCIVKAMGLSHMDGLPSSIFNISHYTTLNEYSTVHKYLTNNQVKVMVTHLTSILELLFIKNILHNNITEQSILMQKFDHLEHCTPVLADFSCACYADNTSYLSKYFQTRFKTYNHLPSDVLNGKQLPSFKTDIFSFGLLISRFAIQVRGPTGVAEKLESLATSVVNNKSNKLPQTLYEYLR